MSEDYEYGIEKIKFYLYHREKNLYLHFRISPLLEDKFFFVDGLVMTSES